MTPEQIKERRLALGWSRAQFADALGVSVRTVERWEAGRSAEMGVGNILDMAIRLLELQAKGSTSRKKAV